MIFQKSVLQGNFVFADGTAAEFKDGIYETFDAVKIDQLKGIYAELDEKPAVKAEAPKEKATAVTGQQSSASLAKLAK